MRKGTKLLMSGFLIISFVNFISCTSDKKADKKQDSVKKNVDSVTVNIDSVANKTEVQVIKPATAADVNYNIGVVDLKTKSKSIEH